MNDYILPIVVLIAVIIIVLWIFLAFRRTISSGDKLYPKGHWVGVGLSVGIGIGMPVGLAIGIAMEKIAVGISLGPAIGVGIGLAIGSGLEEKYKDKIRPLTEQEIRTRKWSVIGGVIILSLGVILLGSLLLFR
jgi:hypothetical protein